MHDILILSYIWIKFGWVPNGMDLSAIEYGEKESIKGGRMKKTE